MDCQAGSYQYEGNLCMHSKYCPPLDFRTHYNLPHFPMDQTVKDLQARSKIIVCVLPVKSYRNQYSV